MALEPGPEVAPDDPRLLITINAPAIPSSTAATMPNTIERFFQILSSTRAPPVRSSDLSSSDVRTIPPAGLSREPEGPRHPMQAFRWASAAPTSDRSAVLLRLR